MGSISSMWPAVSFHRVRNKKDTDPSRGDSVKPPFFIEAEKF